MVLTRTPIDDRSRAAGRVRANDATLRCGVGDLADLAVDGCDGGGVDDGTPLSVVELPIEVDDDGGRPGCGQTTSRGRAQPAGAAGNDGGAAVELHHSIRSMMVALAPPPPSHMTWRP